MTGPVSSSGPSSLVTLNRGSRRATFTGDALPSNIGEGDVLTIDSTYTYYIASRVSTTEVIVQEANVIGDHVGLEYAITRAYSGIDETPAGTSDRRRFYPKGNRLQRRRWCICFLVSFSPDEWFHH
jgi:hypothetical protein